MKDKLNEAPMARMKITGCVDFIFFTYLCNPPNNYLLQKKIRVCSTSRCLGFRRWRTMVKSDGWWEQPLTLSSRRILWSREVAVSKKSKAFLMTHELSGWTMFGVIGPRNLLISWIVEAGSKIMVESAPCSICKLMGLLETLMLWLNIRSIISSLQSRIFFRISDFLAT